MSGWEVRFSNSRQIPYFYNASTQQSVWDPPSDLTEEQIKTIPGASRYLNPPAQREAAPDAGKAGQVRASHILAKHTGSRRPSSWRQDKITRSLDEARQIIDAHLKHLQPLSPAERNQEFAKIASEESDCSSARKGGDLGWFGRGMMQQSFEQATFGIQPGELATVESDSGVHVILRTG